MQRNWRSLRCFYCEGETVFPGVRILIVNLTHSRITLGVSVRDCLNQADLCMCLEIVLIKANDVERSSPLWATPVFRQGI